MNKTTDRQYLSRAKRKQRAESNSLQIFINHYLEGYNSFQNYIQCELKRRKTLSRIKSNTIWIMNCVVRPEPTTKLIARDLDKSMKDPLSTTANKQYPLIELYKFYS